MIQRIINVNPIIFTILLGLFLTLTIQAQTAMHRAPLDFDGDGKTDITVARIFIDLFERQPLQ